jgi:hypothetical protein
MAIATTKVKVKKQGRTLKVKVTPSFGRKLVLFKSNGRYQPKTTTIKASKKKSGWVTLKNLAPGEYWVGVPRTKYAKIGGSFDTYHKTIKIS